VNTERRKRYPDDWEHQAWQCKEDADWMCIVCNIAQREERISRRTGALYPVYLHAAHRDHDIGNPTPALLCLCPTCHGNYDADYRAREQEIALEQLKHQLLLASRR
jgi:hypothetical protein